MIPIFTRIKYRKNKFELTLWLIIILGWLLRFFKAFIFQDIEQDEGNTYQAIIGHSYLNHFLREDYSEEQNHPPLMFILGKLWIQFFDNELLIRIPGFILSCWAVYLFAQIVRRVFAEKKGVVSLSLLYMATSPFFIYFGVIFRTYSMVIALVFLLLKVYLKNSDIEKKGGKVRVLDFIYIAVTTFSALMTDYSSFWFVLPLLLSTVVAKNIFLRSTLAIISGCFLFLPWFVWDMLKNFNTALEIKSRILPTFSEPSSFLEQVALFFNFKYLTDISHNLVIFLVVFSILGLIQVFREKKHLRYFWFFSLVLTNIIVVSFSVKVSPVFDYKHMWFPNLCMVLLAIYSVEIFKDSIDRAIVGSLVAIALLYSGFISIYYYANTGPSLHFVNYKTSVIKKALNYIKGNRGNSLILMPYEGEWSSTLRLYIRWAGLEKKISIENYDQISITDCRSPTYFLDLETIHQNQLYQVELAKKLNGTYRPIPFHGDQIVFGQCLPTTDRDILVKADHVLDPNTGTWFKKDFLVREGRVVEINPKVLRSQVDVIDLKNLYIVPGFIDAHTHLFLDDPTYGENFSNGLLTFYQSHYKRNRLDLGRARSKSLLKSGFTAVRDLGNDGGNLLTSLNHVRFYSSGAGHSPKLGQFPPGTPDNIIFDEYARLNRESLSKLSTNKNKLIKIYADEDPNPTLIDSDTLKKWVERSHQLGIKVAAHAILPKSIDIAIEAGVDSLEHGTNVNEAQLRRMADKNITWVPSTAGAIMLENKFKRIRPAHLEKEMELICKNLQKAQKLGVRVAFGSDNYYSLEKFGVSFGAATIEALIFYKNCGISNLEILRSATINAAYVTDTSLGRLELNSFADFIVFSSDPLRNIEALRRPSRVFKGGVQTKRPRNFNRLYD